MSDPINVATQATQTIADNGSATHAGWAILGGVALKVVEAIAKVFGSRKERAEAKLHEADAAARIVDAAADVIDAEADAAARIVDAAADVIDAQREDTQRVRAERDATANERDTCQEQLREMRQTQANDRRRIAKVERLHRECDERSRSQQTTIEWLVRGLYAVLAGEPLPERPDSMTPPSNHTPDEVRAELAAQEDDHG